MQPCDRLTVKEVQVAMLVWEGQTNREIASVIGTTEQVIKNYLRNTFDKLGVWSRLELALYVAAHGGAHWRVPAGLALDPAKLTAEIQSSLQPAVQRVSEVAGSNDRGSTRSSPKSKLLPGLISA
jgi:DNA-binding CsgD family transcriptional regulator